MNMTHTTDDLSAAVIDEQTRHFDFHNAGVEEYHVIGELYDGERPHRFEPMMNTLWPLPDDFDVPDDIEERLDSMTVVEVNDGAGVYEPHLALTGGGMDMSWSIARTYVNLGLLPPATLGRLPQMGRRTYDDAESKRVIEALKQSHQHMIDRHERDITELDDLGAYQ